jgi:hypothetical protein
MKKIHNIMIYLFRVIFLSCFSVAVTADINATYYDQNGQQYEFFSGSAISRTDANIDFNWFVFSPLAGIGADDFSVRWEGQLAVPSDGNYTFRVRGDDGIRLYLDGVLLVSDWSNHGPRNRDSNAQALLAGQRYELLVEHYERGGGAVARVSWSGPNTGGFQVIPANALFTDINPPEVLSAGYGCSADSISLVFDKNLDPVSAQTTSNYFISNGVTISSATLEADGRTVTLATSSLVEDSYLITINNVANTSGGVIGSGTTITAGFQINGLNAIYYDQNNTTGAYFTGFEVERIDATVDFNWGNGPPVSGIGNDRFSVRWQGAIIAPTTDDFEFRTRSDDGVRLYIDGVLVIENWTNHGPTFDYSPPIPMVAGEEYDVRMEFFENTGGAVAQLQWQSSSFNWGTVAESQLLGSCGLPTLESAAFSCSEDSIRVRFSEAVNAISAEDINNYSLDRGVVINSASLDSDGQTVTLQTSNLGPVDYLLTVNAVEDLDGIVIEPNSEIIALYQSGGLIATYYDQNGISGAYFTGNTLVQIEANIDNDWGSNAPAAGIGADNFSVRWEGNIIAPDDGSYIFRSRSDDGFRLFLDNTEIIDDWVDDNTEFRSSTPQTLVAGQSYRIVAEFYDTVADAVAQLEWSGPGFAMTIIAPEYFINDCDKPVGEWQFEELLWNGSSGEVADLSGADNNGTVIGSANTNYANPARAGNPGTCRYGEFNGVDDYIEIDASFEDKQQSFTITAWINPSTTNPGSRIFVDDENNSGGYGLSVNDPNPGQLQFYARNVTPINVETSAAVISTNAWTHVAAVHDADTKTRTLYVNGVAQALTGGGLSNTYAGNWGVDSGPATIGGETNETAKRFSGAIDEVRFYDSAFASQDIMAIYNETHACENIPVTDHFDIDHSDNAIFCAPTLITVTAEDITNNREVAYSGTVTLDTQSGDGNWLLSSGAGNLVNGVDNDGMATYSFASADQGQAVFSLDRSGMSEGDPLAVNIQVNDNGITDDDLEGLLNFAVSGFTLTGTVLDDSSDPIDVSQGIGTQVAGENANTRFTVFIAAFGETPSDPVCGIIEAYSGSKTLSLGMTYDDPNSGSQSLITPSTTVNFVAGQATLALNYRDVGRIGFSLTEGALVGSTLPFVVKPFRFGIYPDDASIGANVGTAYRRAGEDFGVRVIAENAEGVATPNYGKEAAPEGVVLTSSLVAPLPGDSGNFSGDLSDSANGMDPDSANDGQFFNQFQWSEVGVIALTANVNDSDYLEEGPIETLLPEVGRFTPHHFVVEGTALSPAIDSFTYLGQPFQVSYTLRAQAEDGTTTRNYEGVFSRLSATTAANGFGITYRAEDGVETFNARLLSGNETVVWNNGVATLTNIDLVLARLATPDGPYSNTAVSLTVKDDDGIALLTSQAALVGTTAFRYGRVYMPPVYGPEIAVNAKTEMPFVVEYWADPDGDTVFNFIVNSDDNKTDYTNWTMALCTDGTVSCSDIAINGANSTSTVLLGRSRRGMSNALTVNRPGAGKTGDVTAQIAVDSWLKYDWEGTATDVNPRTQINFGLYRSHDRIIYWREVP